VHWRTEEGRGRKHVPKVWGGERDYSGVDTENCLPAHDLDISIFQVERLVANQDPFATVLSDILVEFGRSQVGYGGDAQRGGRDGGDSVVGECVGGRPHVVRDRETLSALQDGRGDCNIDRGRKILGSESDGGFNPCRDFNSHLILFFPFTFFSRLRDTIPFFPVIPPQPFSMELAKFLVRELTGSDEVHQDK